MQQQAGGGLSFNSFFAAIGGQESGGDYGAVNSRTGASGKYQIMPGNVGPWSQQYLGRRISVGQFRSSPQLQEQLARAVLSSYFQKYGARGAAAAWYSGSASRANDYGGIGHGNEPSVGDYVDQVLGRVGNTPSGAPAPAPGRSMQQPTLDTPPADPLAAPQMSGVDKLEVTPNTLGQVFGPNPVAPSGESGQPSLTGGPIAAGQGSDPTRDKILSEAMRYIGTPYVWGGTSPRGFDCSGLIKYVFGKYGVDLPRISSDQARAGARIGVNQLRPGDLVAWDENNRNSGADHIAIYAGDGWIIEAPHAGADVRRRKLGSNEGAWGVSLSI